MSSPPRLLESGTDFEARLLGAAKRERSSPSAMKRAVAAASSVALGTCAGVAAKSGLLTATKSPAWLAAIGASVGIAGIGVAVLASSSAGPSTLERSSSAEPTSTQPSAPQPIAPGTGVAPVVALVVPTAEAPADAPRVAPRVAPSVAMAAKPRQRAAALSSAPAPRVEDELTLLRRAKGRIAESDPDGALEMLDAHAKSYPRSAFGEEAAALHVEALVARGDGVRAQRAAEAFLERHPDSPYAQRVRSALTRSQR